jgi:hypothetical protein
MLIPQLRHSISLQKYTRCSKMLVEASGVGSDRAESEGAG